MQDFDVCFDPDFVALGTVMKDFRNPRFGYYRRKPPEAGDRIEALHRQMCDNQAENSPNVFNQRGSRQGKP